MAGSPTRMAIVQVGIVITKGLVIIMDTNFSVNKLMTLLFKLFYSTILVYYPIVLSDFFSSN